MIERSVHDVPALGEVFGRVRAQLLDRYERYVRSRCATGAFSCRDPEVTAHLLVEMCWWAAGRRLADAHAASIDASAARSAVCDLAHAALTCTESPHH
jgi:hypothetical protein